MNTLSSKILLVSIVLGLFSGTAFSAFIHVPGDYKTIQDAIDAAKNGDTILVAPEIYRENIDFLGKAITLRSDADGDPQTHDILPEKTIIDGGKPSNPLFG